MDTLQPGLETWAAVLGWALLINIVLFVISALAVMVARKPMASIHAKLLGVDAQSLPAIYLNWLGLYKILIIVLGLAPYIALRIVLA